MTETLSLELLDERLLRQQVFHNPLAYAVEYGPEEGTRMAVEGRAEKGARELSVTFLNSVEANGHPQPGLDPGGASLTLPCPTPRSASS